MSSMVSQVRSAARLQWWPTARAVNCDPPAMSANVIMAGVIGNALEWYDFAIYGYFASVIGRNFFLREIQPSP